MRNEGLTKTMIAGAAIAARRIVKFDGTDAAEVIQAAAATDLSIGVVDLGADAALDPVDVIVDGIVTIEAGGTVAQGAAVTSDGTGRAVTAVSTNRVIGIAMEGAVVGDLFGVKLSQGYW